MGGIPIPRTLYKKRVTVVGFGAVGSCLVHYLVTMGADVTVVRRKWPPPEREGASDPAQDGSAGHSAATFLPSSIHKSTSLREALPTTQVLILACTLTPETVHCINRETIGLLPPGALVVNVARGGLVEHGAMLEALKSGAVGGFASDVGVGHPTKPSEPWDPHDEISQLPNVLFTPHVGGYTDYSYSVMSRMVVDAIEHVGRGEPPPVWVNEPDR
jgi:phosphoglycerate dehydrogenase-like enzyme